MKRTASAIAGLTLVHVASAELAVPAEPAQAYTTFLSPPMGVSLVFVMMGGNTVAAGVFLGTLLLKLSQAATPATAFVVAASNTVEVLTAVALLRRTGFRPSLDRLRDVAALTIAAGLLAASLGATLAIGTLLATGDITREQVAAAWFARWWGHAAGAVVVAPALFTWIANRRVDRRRLPEAAAFTGALALAFLFVVSEPKPPWPEGSPATYVLFPLLAWAAIRFGPRGAATTVLAVTLTAIAVTSAGWGPFVHLVWHEGVANVQAFVTLLAVTTMILAAAAAERVSGRLLARASEVRRAAMVEAALDAVVTIDANARIQEMNPAAERLFGLDGKKSRGRRMDLLAVPEHLLGRLREVPAYRSNGSEFMAEMCVVRLPTDVPEFTAFIRDVTELRDAERALRAAHDELERRVVERTEALRVANQELEEAVAEKELLLHEVHHRVKNNLQIVSSLLHLQAAGLEDAGARRAFDESESRVRAIALVHGLLQNDEEDRLDVHDYLERLVTHLRSTYGGTSVVIVKVEPRAILLPLEKAVPLGLIVNELVSNAMKHAFPQGAAGRVIVSFRESEGGAVLSVSDDGRGMPPELDWRQVTTVGLQVVRSLAKQLQATLDLDRTRGTTFRITFGG